MQSETLHKKRLKSLWVQSWKAPLPFKGLWVANAVLRVPTAWTGGIPFIPVGREVYRQFQAIRKAEGLRTAQDRFKAAAWATKKWLMRDPVSQDWARSERIGLDRKGLPRLLPVPIRRALRSSENRLTRAVSLYLLSLFKCYTSKRKANYQPIVAPSTSSATVELEYRRVLPVLLLMLGVAEPLVLKKPKLFATNRGGPNGHALLCAHLDAAAWLQNQEVGRWLLAWAQLWKDGSGVRIIERMTTLGKLTQALGPIVGPRLELGKTAHKMEPAKVRIFAISDYWTQVLLRPLHDALMAVLKSIPQDATWNQEAGGLLVRKWSAEGRRMWSFDLSNATDRFPVTVQAAMVDFLLRDYTVSKPGQIWRSLLTARTYRTPSGEDVRYGAGQPMGTLSSWAAFALAHHTVVQWAALQCGRRSFTDYTMLGDDIVIADGPDGQDNSDVAAKYVEILARLGVDVNRTKSVQAKGAAEFAKRSFVDGAEITGLDWSLSSLGATSGVYLYQFLSELVRREYQPAWEGVLEVSVGPSKARAVPWSVRNLLWALIEPTGPLEETNMWVRTRTAHSASDWWKLVPKGLVPLLGSQPVDLTGSDTDATPDGLQEMTEGCIRLFKAATYRLVLQGYDIAKALEGQLDSLLKAQLLESEARRIKVDPDFGDVPLQLLHEKLSALMDSFAQGEMSHRYAVLSAEHPARDVLEEGLDPTVYSDVAQQVRVLTQSDKEELYPIRDRVKHSGARLRASHNEWKDSLEQFF